MAPVLWADLSIIVQLDKQTTGVGASGPSLHLTKRAPDAALLIKAGVAPHEKGDSWRPSVLLAGSGTGAHPLLLKTSGITFQVQPAKLMTSLQ